MTEQTTVDDDAARVAAERPAHRRAPMWDARERIQQLLAAGRSYGQIVRMLHLPVSPSRLGKWCRHVGLVEPRPYLRAADKKSAPTAAATAPRPAPAGAPCRKAKSISDLIAEDEAAQRAELARFFKPKSE